MENSAETLKTGETFDLNQEEPVPVIVDLSRVVDIDFTAAIVSLFREVALPAAIFDSG